MALTQTVDIPENRRLTIEVPREVPFGKTILTFTPVSPQNNAQNRKPVSHYFGILSPGTYGDAVAYQRKLRDEWDD